MTYNLSSFIPSGPTSLLPVCVLKVWPFFFLNSNYFSSLSLLLFAKYWILCFFKNQFLIIHPSICPFSVTALGYSGSWSLSRQSEGGGGLKMALFKKQKYDTDFFKFRLGQHFLPPGSCEADCSPLRRVNLPERFTQGSRSQGGSCDGCQLLNSNTTDSCHRSRQQD